MLKARFFLTVFSPAVMPSFIFAGFYYRVYERGNAYEK